jgi:hypothetical protein
VSKRRRLFSSARVSQRRELPRSFSPSEYMSAVSTKLMPPSSAVRTMAIPDS